MPAKSQSSYVTEASAFIETWLNHYFPLLNQPSLSLAIAHEGKVVYSHAWGYANVAKKEAATPSHIYRVASHSKSLTAFLVALLVDEGKLKLDEPIVTYLPWLKPNKTYAAFTLRQVLSHSTGTERDGDNSQYWDYAFPFPDSADLKAYFLKAKPVLEPNTRLKYSNYGFALAGFVLEAVTGQSFEDLLATRIAKPLGLKHTSGDNPARGQKVCTGYSTPINGERTALDPLLSAGGMTNVTGTSSTPSDLATIFSAFLLGTDMISRTIQKEIIHPVWPASPKNTSEQWYCLGLGKITRDGKEYYGHSGGYPGFITRTMTAPDLGITISLGMSALNADSLSLAHAIYDILRFFQSERGTNNPLTKYESPFYYLWGQSHTLAGAGKLHLTFLTVPNPVTGATILRSHKGDTFINEGPDGYYSIEEPVTFTFKGTKPTAMRYGSAIHTADKATYLAYLKSIAVNG